MLESLQDMGDADGHPKQNLTYGVILYHYLGVRPIDYSKTYLPENIYKLLL